ncbi:MAG: lipoyl(octanoyl) transferase LipB [Usitatibacter sp.]
MKIRDLGIVAYVPTWRAMQAFTQARTAATPDEMWLVQHPAVFTLGLAGRREHVLDAGDVPVVATDRGGQVTYPGPGQAIAYVLVDLRRGAIGVKELVRRIEEAVIETLRSYGVAGERRKAMPGVYVGGAKIAAIGLRIARGCSYHGVALNVSPDLAAFSRIDPCGYPGLASARRADLGVRVSIHAVQQNLAAALSRHLVPATAGQSVHA